MQTFVRHHQQDGTMTNASGIAVLALPVLFCLLVQIPDAAATHAAARVDSLGKASAPKPPQGLRCQRVSLRFSVSADSNFRNKASVGFGIHISQLDRDSQPI
jgi:hypothetical protein